MTQLQWVKPLLPQDIPPNTAPVWDAASEKWTFIPWDTGHNAIGGAENPNPPQDVSE